MGPENLMKTQESTDGSTSEGEEVKEERVRFREGGDFLLHLFAMVSKGFIFCQSPCR